MVQGLGFGKFRPLCASARRFPLKWQKELCFLGFPLSPEVELKFPVLSLGEGRATESPAGGGVTSFLFLDSVLSFLGHFLHLFIIEGGEGIK